MPTVRTEPAQQRCRRCEQVNRIDDGRDAAGAPDDVLENLDLLRQSRVGERAGFELRRARQHRPRVANQEGVGNVIEPVAPHVGQQVMRHLLLKLHPGCWWQWLEQLGDDRAPLGRLRRDDLIAHRVPEPGDGEVMRIERLIDHHGIATIAEGTHQRGRDIAGSRPHGEPQGSRGVVAQGVTRRLFAEAVNDLVGLEANRVIEHDLRVIVVRIARAPCSPPSNLNPPSRSPCAGAQDRCGAPCQR
jgi:hypothetical protein